MKICALYSRSASLSRYSGYDRLAVELTEARILTAPRGDTGRLFPRTRGRLYRAAAASRWYQGSSADVEWQAAALLRRERPDILHYLWTEHDLGYLASWAKRISPPTRLVGTVHLPPAAMREVFRRPGALRHFDALVVMSPHQRGFLESVGVKSERVHFLPHGVDTGFFRPGPAERPAPFRVISVGGFMRDFELLRRVCQACADNRAIQFDILAPASARSFFADLPNVTHRHGVSDDELAAAYRAASCLLLTLIDATANNALLEAMASGLPIVSEDLGGVSAYADASCARLCAPKDAAALATAIKALAASPSEARELGLAARRRAERLAWPAIADQTTALYRQLLDAR